MLSITRNNSVSSELTNCDWKGKHVNVGGGIIGLAIAWQLSRNLEDVVLIDSSEVGKGASWAAAGMLAPYAEIGFEEIELFEMCAASLGMYPKFLNELRSDLPEAPCVPALDSCGSLIVALTSDDERYLNRLHDFQTRMGLEVQKLSAAEARECEPLLSTRVHSALLLKEDKQINNRSLIQALRVAFESRGGKIYEHRTVDLDAFADGESVIISAGAHSSFVDNSVQESNPVRPVKGQIITLKYESDFRLKYMIRTPRVYITAKDDGRLLVGATSEEKGFDTSVTAGPVMELLHYAWEVVPAIYDLEITEINAQLRPATRNNLPLIEYSGSGNRYYATGHYRHGILLTPYTAYRMRALLSHSKASLHHQEAIA